MYAPTGLKQMMVLKPQTFGRRLPASAFHDWCLMEPCKTRRTEGQFGQISKPQAAFVICKNIKVKHKFSNKPIKIFAYFDPKFDYKEKPAANPQ